MPYPHEHAARVRDPGDFEENSFRRQEIADGVSIIIGKIKGEEDMTVQSYRFDAEKFTAEAARQWLKEHEIDYEFFEPAEEEKKEEEKKEEEKKEEEKETTAQTSRLLTLTGDVAVRAAADLERTATEEPLRVSILAYSGGVMSPPGWSDLIIDLEGADLTETIPILAAHQDQNLDSIIGQGVAVVRDHRLYVEGQLVPATDYGRKAIALARAGVALQASVGFQPEKIDRVEAGETIMCNGQLCTARSQGLKVVRAGRLREVSLVPVGADWKTKVLVAAQAAHFKEEHMEKNITSWKNSTAERLENIRAQRPAPPAVHAQSMQFDCQVIEAACRLGGNEKQADLEKEYDSRTLEKAWPLRRMGLRGLIEACCALDGRAAPPAWASEQEVIRAAFSTASLPGILGALQNKVLLAAYQSVPSVAKIVAKKLTANDFKTHTGYMLTGDAKMLPLGDAGEIKHGTLGESGFAYKVNTVARIFGITREMLRNDDLGALTNIAQMLGRGAALALEEAFWSLVMSNANSFFSSGNNNYVSDAVLSIDGLNEVLEIFRSQTDANGDPILLSPRYLVVPPALEATAWEIFKSTNIVVVPVGLDDGAAHYARGTANIHAGKYEPLVSPYLSNSKFPNYSETAWYLFSDPADVAAFGIAYLDGNENPAIEEAPQAANVLGTGWRGYFDFGVCQIDPRGAVMSGGTER